MSHACTRITEAPASAYTAAVPCQKRWLTIAPLQEEFYSYVTTADSQETKGKTNITIEDS